MSAASEAGIGHNKGPVFNEEVVAAFEAEAAEIADAASEWASAEIANETTAGLLKDFIDATKKKAKEVEDRRVVEKKPHKEAAEAVDAAFKKPTTVLKRAVQIATDRLQSYLAEQTRIANERRRAEQEAARKAAEEAERERRIAERNANAAAQVEAEEKAAQAAAAAKAAERQARVKVASATGTGAKGTALRTTRSARITNINQAMLHYRERPELADVITRMANADIRAAKGADIAIPGIEIIKEEHL